MKSHLVKNFCGQRDTKNYSDGSRLVRTLLFEKYKYRSSSETVRWNLVEMTLKFFGGTSLFFIKAYCIHFLNMEICFVMKFVNEKEISLHANYLKGYAV